MKDEEPEKQQFSLSTMEERDTESEADDLTNQGHIDCSQLLFITSD